MELSWLMRVRIAAAALVGICLIGICAWPLAKPSDFYDVISLSAKDMGAVGAAVLVGLAFIAGATAYFVSWPYGREIGILAVPAGLAVWAVRCGNIGSLMQTSHDFSQRQAFLAGFRWEPFFWLAVVAAGFMGVLTSRRISGVRAAACADKKLNRKPNIYLLILAAIAGSVLVAQFCIGVLAKDIQMSDGRMGMVVVQPVIGQIVFAVLVSFGAAGFVCKLFLNVSYIWSAIASAVVSVLVNIFYLQTKTDLLRDIAGRLPAVVFPNAILAILPVQMVAFGTLGAIAGYWIAVRYEYWREHGDQYV